MSELRMVTWNLRYDAKPNTISVSDSIKRIPDALSEPPYMKIYGEQPWSTRRIRVAQCLLTEKPVLAGFQEALLRQVNDMKELLGEDKWDFIGVGRDDGYHAGEFSPIFYNKQALELVSWDTFWLSNTPFLPSKYPGAGSYRLCTIGYFDVQGKTKLTVFNCHLDNASDAQRRMGASLILWRARYEAIKTKSSVLVMGDFNSTADGKDSSAYEVITGNLPPMKLPEDFVAKYPIQNDEQADFTMIDLKSKANPLHISGHSATFTDFHSPSVTKDWCRIDFIFGGSNGHWSVGDYNVPSGLSDDGVLASDHRPVFTTITI